MKVVIVEDEIRIREGICRLILKDRGVWEVVGQADNGLDGLEMIMKLEPDLIITDVRMPKMDGLEMLYEAFKQQSKAKAIVLSAYSEFAYAQQAIKLGVSEYLLKPVVVNEFITSLKNIRNQYEQIIDEKSDEIQTLKQTYLGLIMGGMVPDSEFDEFVETRYGITKETQFTEVIVSFGRVGAETFRKTNRLLEVVLNERYEGAYSILQLPKEKSLLIIIHGKQEGIKFVPWFQNRVLLTGYISEPIISFGCINCIGIDLLKSQFYTLLKYMDWSIVLGSHIMIDYPKVTHMQTVPCMYPIELNKQMKVALCANHHHEVKRLMHLFEDYFEDGKIYEPKEIKDYYVRFIWSIINMLKEIGLNYNRINQRNLIESIASAKHDCDLRDIVCSFNRDIIGILSVHNEVDNLVVRKTIKMVHELYQTGITLDEIAMNMNLTPEYLGTQFHKETGKLFSTYIKEYRINKAKELLISTTLKQYEVTIRVGYSDSKYFSRVFKEATGMSPTDYRNFHK